jgi:hypothetical protein
MKRRRLEVLGPFSLLTYRCAAALEEKDHSSERRGPWLGLKFPKSFYVHYSAMIISELLTYWYKSLFCECIGDLAPTILSCDFALPATVVES